MTAATIIAGLILIVLCRMLWKHETDTQDHQTQLELAFEKGRVQGHRERDDERADAFRDGFAARGKVEKLHSDSPNSGVYADGMSDHGWVGFGGPRSGPVAVETPLALVPDLPQIH